MVMDGIIPIMDTVGAILIMDMDGVILIMDMAILITATVILTMDTAILIMDIDTTIIIHIIPVEEVLLMPMEFMAIIDILKILPTLPPEERTTLILEEVPQIAGQEMIPHS